MSNLIMITDYQTTSPDMKRFHEQTDTEALYTTKAGSQSSPDKILRQKMLQLSDGKAPSKFNGISFQKCENFDEEVIDPQQVIKRINNGLCIRQGINGILQFVVILLNCLYVKNGENIYCTFAFVIGLISQWLLFQIHMDKYDIQQIHELQKQRMNKSNSPKKKSKENTNGGGQSHKRNPSNNNENHKSQKSIDEIKISKPRISAPHTPKMLNNSQKSIPKINLNSRQSSISHKINEEEQIKQNNSMNNHKQNQSLQRNNINNNTPVNQPPSSSNKRRATSMIGGTNTAQSKQSKVSSVQPSPKNGMININTPSTNSTNSNQIMMSTRNRNLIQSIDAFNTKLNNHNKNNQNKNNSIEKQSTNFQLEMAIIEAENKLKEDQQQIRRGTIFGNDSKTGVRIKTFGNEISTETTKREKPKRKRRKSTKRAYQNDEMTVLKKSKLWRLLKQLNYQWIQYLINIVPLITFGIKEENILRNLLLLQLLRGIFLIDAIIAYQRVDVTHQYSKYARYYLHAHPINFVTTYLLFIIMLFSYIYYVIEDSLYLWDSIWNIIVSITTIGYGDIVPITNAGRILIIVCSNLGVIFLSFIASLMQSTQEFSPKEQKSFNKAMIQLLKEQNIYSDAAYVIVYHLRILNQQKKQKQNNQVAINFNNLDNRSIQNNNVINLFDQNNNRLDTFMDSKYKKQLSGKNSNNSQQNKMNNLNLDSEGRESSKNNQINQMNEINAFQKDLERQDTLQNQKQDQQKVEGITDNQVKLTTQNILNTFTYKYFNLQQQRKNKSVTKIRKFFQEQKLHDDTFLKNLSKRTCEIKNQISPQQPKISYQNTKLFENKFFNDIKLDFNLTSNRRLSTAITRKKDSAAFQSDILTPGRQLSYRAYRAISINQNQEKLQQIDVIQNLNTDIQRFLLLHKEIGANLLEIEKATQSNKILNNNNEQNQSQQKIIQDLGNNSSFIQNNSLLAETPKQTPKNIPSITNLKTMTFQAVTNRSLNTSETPVNNNRRIPEPFMMKFSSYTDDDLTSNNCSKLQYNQECQGDLDNQSMQNSQPQEQLIVFNQSSDPTPANRNIPEPFVKFSSYTDDDLTSHNMSKFQYNQECKGDVDLNSIQASQPQDNLMLFNEPSNFEGTSYEEQNKTQINKTQGYLNQLNATNQFLQNEIQNVASELEYQQNITLIRNSQTNTSDFQSEKYNQFQQQQQQQLQTDQVDENDQKIEDNSDEERFNKSDICGQSVMTYNQISAPPSALPTAKFISKDNQLNNIHNGDDNEEEEDESDNFDTNSYQKKYNNLNDNMNQISNSIITPGFTDKYLKSNPKFLQDVNQTSENYMKPNQKVRQFSIGTTKCIEQNNNDNINNFYNNQQTSECSYENQNLFQNRDPNYHNEPSKREVPVLIKRCTLYSKNINLDFNNNINN